MKTATSLAAAVDLDADAVELPLDRGRASRASAVGDVGGREAASIGRSGRPHVSRHRLEADPSGEHARRRHLGGVAGEHGPPTHRGVRHAGGPGDGLDHHPVERALPQARR